MTTNGKIQIVISSIPRDGTMLDSDLPQERIQLAEACVRTIEHTHSSLLELHIVVTSDNAEQVLAGMVKGETAISIGKIFPNSQPN